MEKYYFLQENKETVNLYFDNTTNKESFFVAISLYKYLESKVTNPVLLSWMDSTKIVKNYERLDYHVVRSLRVKMDPFLLAIMEIMKEKELMVFQFVVAKKQK